MRFEHPPVEWLIPHRRRSRQWASRNLVNQEMPVSLSEVRRQPNEVESLPMSQAEGDPIAAEIAVEGDIFSPNCPPLAFQ